MNIFVIASLAFSFCSFLFGLIIYFKRKDKLGLLWFLFNLCSAIWGLGYAFQINNDVPYETALLMTRIGDSVVIFLPIFWLHFIHLFLEKKIQKTILRILYGASSILFLFSPTPWFISRLQDKSHIGVLHFADGGIVFHIFSALYALTVFFGFIFLLQTYLEKERSEESRQQIRRLLFSATLGFGGGSLAFLPVYHIDLPVLYGILLAPLFPILMARAFSRYHLLDTEELAQAAHNDKLAAIGVLSASINHELRNPLYIIKNFSESLAINTREGVYSDPEKLQEKMLETLDRITRQSDNAMKIIGRLTAFARKKPDQDFKRVPVALPALLSDLDILIRCEIEIHRIQIIEEIPKGLPLVLVDPSHLEEILLNLILNAYQVLKTYSTETQKQIHIQAFSLSFPRKRESKSGSPTKALGDDKIRITIKDNGPGISPDDLSNIFKPFYTKKQEGLGLGLYITKQLVEKNRGTIRVESKPGQGASFILEFQRA